MRWGSPEGPGHVEVPQKVQVTWRFTPGQAGSPEGPGHVEVPQKVQVTWRFTLESGGFARRPGSREDFPRWSGLGGTPEGPREMIHTWLCWFGRWSEVTWRHVGLLSAMIILSATQLKNKEHLYKLWNMRAKSQAPW